MKILPLALILFTSFVAPAFAADGDDIRKATECRPAKDIIKLFSKFDKLKPGQRDTVDAIFDTKFIVENGPFPDRLYYSHDGIEMPFTISPDGAVPDFAKITKQPQDGDLCIDDPTREGLHREEDGLEFSVDFDVKFKNMSGAHSLAELKDGAKDGKSFYKKLMPGPMKLMVPTLTYVSVTYDDASTAPDIQALKDGAPVEGLIIEPFGTTSVISLKHLEEIGAEGLKITGGAYMMEPSPSIEKMKSMGFTEDSEDAAEK